MSFKRWIGMFCMFPIASLLACAPTEPNELDKLGTTSVKINNLTVTAWIANDNDERAKGLMFVPAEDMKPLSDGSERGMLFVFERDQRNGFWMRNTIIDLDIAFIREDGQIVQTFTMAALDESSYTPRAAYRYALEVNAGVFSRDGIKAGDQVEIPESVLKGVK